MFVQVGIFSPLPSTPPTPHDWMTWSQCCSHCWQHCLISSTEMLSRVTSNFRWTSATLAKCLPFKFCYIHGYKKKSRKERGQVSRGVGHNHHFVWPKTVGCSRLCGRGHCHGARNNPHSAATFLDVFVTGSHAIISPHSGKTTDLLCALEEQTPCAISHQYKKKRNRHCLDTCMNLPRFFWSERLWWLTLTWLLLWLGRSSSTKPHLLLQLLWETEGHIWAVPANHSKHSCAPL